MFSFISSDSGLRSSNGQRYPLLLWTGYGSSLLTFDLRCHLEGLNGHFRPHVFCANSSDFSASILKEGLQEGLRKAVCEPDLKKRRYKGVKKAVSKGFYEIEREKKKAEEQDRKAVYEENLRKRRFRAALKRF